jgi:hypothetical protein
MRKTTFVAPGLVILTLLALLPRPVSAVPVFARKYGFNCTMCHSAYPQLNDFGARYRQNGYQLPGRENEERTVLEGPAPVAMRASGGYTSVAYEGMEGTSDLSEFQMNGLDLLSAGLLGAGIGYLVVYPPEIAPAHGVESQTGTLEMASVIFADVVPHWLDIRLGRFEPAYVAASVKRRLSIAPYEIYAYGDAVGLRLDETQTGIEVTGERRGFSYAAGYVNGSSTNATDDGPADVYARVAMVIGAGEGQTAGQRIGVMGFLGKARPAPALVDEEVDESCRSNLQRFGVDAALNYANARLAGQYIMGKDDKELWGLPEDAEFSGGFAELSYMPMTKLVGFARYGWVVTPENVDADITRLTCGVRYYFVDNVATHVEYSQRRQEQLGGDDIEETLITARLDCAF